MQHRVPRPLPPNHDSSNSRTWLKGQGPGGPHAPQLVGGTPGEAQLAGPGTAALTLRVLARVCRQAEGVPVYTLGNATVEGLRRLFDQLGARPGGSVHLVVTDLREELVLYINGTAYMRRELEMPAAALHHAGALPRPYQREAQHRVAGAWSRIMHS